MEINTKKASKRITESVQQWLSRKRCHVNLGSLLRGVCPVALFIEFVNLQDYHMHIKQGMTKITFLTILPFRDGLVEVTA
jgi:hypothetical protein